MIKGTYISFKTIVAKLYRDLQLKEEESFTNILEWVGESLDFIHVYPQYITKSECVKITSFKGELPCDYISMIGLEHNGYSLKYSTNIFGPQDNTRLRKSDTPYSFNENKIKNIVFVDPSNINYFSNRDSVLLQNGYIKTSFKEGDILINYIAMVLDCDGYPMIPDEQSFKEAVYWYCTYKYLYAKALYGEINSQFYEDAYQKWQYYCNQAGAEAMMPDLATLENIKRSFISLKPNLNRFNNFFQ